MHGHEAQEKRPRCAEAIRAAAQCRPTQYHIPLCSFLAERFMLITRVRFIARLLCRSAYADKSPGTGRSSQQRRRDYFLPGKFANAEKY